ncbi:SGNH/GDSL hydrolase family protein [Commensalibacter oyaizuii]|uniref:SGNH/GDSL hydrolase family protein n=1 Tax=Commensalibacter oyaizuii TaxID=3043873 RepID=A0ABT6Q299_9PROT|nr:SGNH/GDSL hydrolase family protein [Commensalibacter sp. TBRC 16381]MDI2091230.1 SGNH/GDSL hydrolase family protein [Commensalibacter sp. TBRC 16381]
MAKKTILFYGDSNTHGTKPMPSADSTERFQLDERWPGILHQQLKQDYHIIEEGLPGRTTVHNDPIEGSHKNGLAYLRPCLESHRPIDIIVLMLGTNDLKARFSVTPADIAHSIHHLIIEIKSCQTNPQSDHPKILLLCPAPILEIGELGEIFAGGEEKSKHLARYYKKIADNHKISFFDIGSVVHVSKIDGVHFDSDQHQILAENLQKIITIL